MWSRRVSGSRTSFRGNRVHQRSDLIGPGLDDRTGITNLHGMQEGLALIGPDVRAIKLHHMLHTNAPNSALRQLIYLNRQTYPGVF